MINPPNRFEPVHLEIDPALPPEERPNPKTQFFFDATESLLTPNDSPDVGFDVGLNCYRRGIFLPIAFFSLRTRTLRNRTKGRG